MTQPEKLTPYGCHCSEGDQQLGDEVMKAFRV
jgi:hypothetical protein